MQDIGKDLLRARRELNLTTKDLAKQIGVTEGFIRAIECRSRHPKAREAYEKVVNFVERVRV